MHRETRTRLDFAFESSPATHCNNSIFDAASTYFPFITSACQKTCLLYSPSAGTRQI